MEVPILMEVRLRAWRLVEKGPRLVWMCCGELRSRLRWRYVDGSEA